MKHDLVIRPEAEEDLQDTYNWYEDRAEGLGASFLLSIDASFHSMLRNPQKYPIVYKTIRRALTRRFP
jgi:plasmid stabilization system protein ParE